MALTRRPRGDRAGGRGAAGEPSSGRKSTRGRDRARRRHAARRAARLASARGAAHSIPPPRRVARSRTSRPASLRGRGRPRGRDHSLQLFDALGFPPWHPSRSPRASLYLDDDHLAAQETSPAQIHKMEAQAPADYMVSIGRVYRRDTIDATHTDLPPVEGPRDRQGHHDGRPERDAVARHGARSSAQSARFASARITSRSPSVDGADVSCSFAARRLPDVQALRVDRARGSGMVDPYLYEFVGWGRTNTRASPRRGHRAARRSCSTTSTASARSGRTTCAS